MKPIGQRFLVVYAGVLTAVCAVTVLGGLARAPRSLALEQLDVQRINVREGNGTLRLAISGADGPAARSERTAPRRRSRGVGGRGRAGMPVRHNARGACPPLRGLLACPCGRCPSPC